MAETRRRYRRGEDVVPFSSTARIPNCYLSNYAVVESGVRYEGLVYPSVEHAFQAQKYRPESRPAFSVTGIYGNPTDNFHHALTAFYMAKYPHLVNHGAPNAKIKGKVEEMKRSDHKINANRTFGTLAEQVSDFAEQGAEQMKALKLKPNRVRLDEAFWLEVLRSKFEDDRMRDALLRTRNDYLIAEDEGRASTYTAHYDKTRRNCEECNDPSRNLLGKWLMRIRSEIRGEPDRGRESPDRGRADRRRESPDRGRADRGRESPDRGPVVYDLSDSPERQPVYDLTGSPSSSSSDVIDLTGGNSRKAKSHKSSKSKTCRVDSVPMDIPPDLTFAEYSKLEKMFDAANNTNKECGEVAALQRELLKQQRYTRGVKKPETPKASPTTFLGRMKHHLTSTACKYLPIKTRKLCMEHQEKISRKKAVHDKYAEEINSFDNLQN